MGEKDHSSIGGMLAVGGTCWELHSLHLYAKKPFCAGDCGFSRVFPQFAFGRWLCDFLPCLWDMWERFSCFVVGSNIFATK
jgi:hypothetical protein